MIENGSRIEERNETEFQASGRKPPKNVRQSGYFTGDLRIYMEDYVHTFTRWLAEQDYSVRSVAVLVGEFARSEHSRDVYAYGAVAVEEAYQDGKLELSGDIWTYIYETIKRYFPEGEIVGWFYGGASFTQEEQEQLQQLHVDYFAGADRILMLYDYLEREEEFYRFSGGSLVKQSGYYIYYEKNEEMQNYMIDKKQGRRGREETEDRAVREIRARLGVQTQTNDTEEAEKLTGPEHSGLKKEEEERNSRFLYTAGIVMAAVAVVAGASMVYSQERLKSFEQTLNQIVGSVQGADGNMADNPEEKLAEGGKEPTGGVGIFDDPDVLETFQNLTPAADDKDLTPTQEGDRTVPDDGAELTPSGERDNTVASPTPVITPSAGASLTEAVTPTAEPVPAKETENAAGQPEDSPAPGVETEGEKSDAEDESEVESGGNAMVDTSAYQYYVVKSGDTLAGICMKLYGNLDNLEFIKGLNQITNEDLIYADQELLIP